MKTDTNADISAIIWKNYLPICFKFLYFFSEYSLYIQISIVFIFKFSNIVENEQSWSPIQLISSFTMIHTLFLLNFFSLFLSSWDEILVC